MTVQERDMWQAERYLKMAIEVEATDPEKAAIYLKRAAFHEELAMMPMYTWSCKLVKTK